MSLLHFVDPDGDPVAVDSLAIVAVSVGRMTDHAPAQRLRPLDSPRVETDREVALLHTQAGPIIVGQPYEEVVRRWQLSRGYVPTEVFDAPGR